MGLDDLTSLLLKLYVYWAGSGFILLGLSLLWVWLTGSFVELFTELIISLVLESIIFPFNLMVAWVITPLQVVFHAIIFVILVSVSLVWESQNGIF